MPLATVPATASTSGRLASMPAWISQAAASLRVVRTPGSLALLGAATALLAFQDVRVPADALLGQEGKGFYHIMWELQGERLIGAAGCVAGAQAAFDRTLAYAQERKAFGREIGHFQVIRHKFAAMATKIEACRQLVYTTAWRFANGEYPVREISMAKLYASRVAVEVADECIQIHGGAGYMKEYGVERVWRDMRLNRIGAGTDEIMLEVSADVCALFNADRLTIYSVGEDKQAIVSKVKTGLNSFKDLKLPIAEHSIAGYVALAKKAINIKDCYDDAELRSINKTLSQLETFWTGYINNIYKIK